MHFRKTVNILKCIIVVILLIIYYRFFFKGVIDNYSQGLTNLATMDRKLEDEIGIKAPAFVICMEPIWKTEVLEKYNITSPFFMLNKGSFEHLNDKKTMKEIISEASFRMNEDYKIAITTYQPPLYDDSTYMNVGENTFISNGNEFSINVAEVFSIQKGMCYTIKSNLYLSAKYSYILSVILGDNIQSQEPIQMEVTLASDDDALGIMFGLWGNIADAWTLPNIQFNNKTTMIDLKETIKKRILNCNKDGTPYQECVSVGFASGVNSSDCHSKCKPMITKAYFDTLIGKGEKLPDCDNLENERCMIRVIEKFSEHIGHCESQCVVKDYSGEAQLSDFENPMNLEDGKRADLFILSSTRTRKWIQEYEIYDTAGMIGTVGGSLGLFLGFSFYGVFSDSLEILLKKIIKQG